MTEIPTIAPLPPAPQRGQDAAVFVQRADAFIDALILFVTQLNVFAAQLVTATQERVVNEAAGSYAGAIAARDAAIAARDAAQAFANSINPANLVNLTANQAIAGTKNFTGILQLAGAAITAAATFPEAATADMVANVDKRLLSVRAAWNALVPVVLADAATIALDLNTGIHFTLTLSGNRVLGAPTNLKLGQEGFIRIVQDAVGGRTLSFAAAYKFPDLVTAPSLNAAAGAVTLLRYHVSGAGEVFVSGGRSGAALPALGYRSGSQYGPPYPGGAQQIVLGGTMFVPVEIRAAVTIAAVCARIVQNVSVIGSIYSNDKGRPGVRLVQSASINVNTGTQTKCPLSITLQPGFYWLALSYNGSAQTYGTTSNMAVNGYFERPETTDGTLYDSVRSSDTAPPATFAEASSPALQNYSPIITFQVA